MDKVTIEAMDQIHKSFEQIEATLDCCGPIEKFPNSLLKARIDCLTLLLSIELEMIESS